MLLASIYKILIILVPTYAIALLTDKMIYVIPMLAVCTLIASSIGNKDNKNRLDEDGYKKDDGLDMGSRKDDG
jgi:hypothetical protein